MALKLANNAVGNLAAPMTTGDTTLTLQSGQGARFPVLGAGDWHPVTVVKVDGSLEIMRATARTGDILTVSRAQEGTTALAFSANDLAQLRWTKAVVDELIMRDGTVAMTGNLDLGTTNKIINLAAGTVATDAVNKGQVDAGGTGTYDQRGAQGGDISASTVRIQSAEYIRLVRADGTTLRATHASGNLDASLGIAGPAAGGRDQAGAFAAGTFVTLYYIYNEGTSTLATMWSANPVNPNAMPAGYTAWCRIGIWRLDASVNLVPMRWRHKTGFYDTYDALVSNGQNAATGGSAVSPTTPVTTWVPPAAIEYGLSVTLSITPAGGAAYGLLTYSTLAGGLGQGGYLLDDNVGALNQRYTTFYMVFPNTGTLYLTGTFYNGSAMFAYARVKQFTIP